MSRRLLVLFLAGIVSLAGLTFAQGPPDNDEPPVRLKKKSRGDDKPKVDPDKPDEKKKDEKKNEKKEDKKAEPGEAEPVTPQEEEKEVLQRVVTNVHRVGERLAQNDLGEATQQTQRDILKDLESLIHIHDVPLEEGGAQGLEKGDQTGEAVGLKKVKVRRKLNGKGQGVGQQRAGNEDRAGKKPGGKNGQNGNGGGGGDKDDRTRNKNADLDKHGVWGHLPQTVRAQMDAYSNPQPFIPKYDDLIKRYYRTISEQGRRKGE